MARQAAMAQLTLAWCRRRRGSSSRRQPLPANPCPPTLARLLWHTPVGAYGPCNHRRRGGPAVRPERGRFP